MADESATFDVTLEELKALMQLRGIEAVQKVCAIHKWMKNNEKNTYRLLKI
jgi:hypothetical protein